MPKGLDSQIFSPANLNLEIGKKGSHHFRFHWNLQTEIWEADMVRKFYLLLAFVRGPSISSSVAVLGDFFQFFPASEDYLDCTNCWGGGYFPLLLFFWLT